MLRAAGLAAAPGDSVIDGRPFHYVTVLARDDLAARALVGLPEVSVRSRRRARQARAKARTEPMNPPAR
jgi:hypothetical protein